MYIRRLVSIILISIILTAVVACSTGPAVNKDVPAGSGTAAGTKTGDSSAAPEISIYYLANVNYVANAILEFKGKYPGVKVNPKLFFINSKDDFNKALSTEVLTGGGPDIIVCKPLRDMDSISKIFNNGAFADLNQYISKDKEFKISGYRSTVVNAGVFGGKRMFMPIYYALPVLYTTESVLKKNNINISENCSVSELDNLVDSFLKDKSKKSKYLFDSQFSFYYLMNSAKKSFIDYQNKKSYFDSKEFKELLRLYKKMQPVIAPEITGDYKRENISRPLKNNTVVFSTDTYGSLFSFFSDTCFIDYDFKEDLKIVKITGSKDNKKLRPVITDIAAINNNCKNKELAFDFIKVLLSEEIQRVEYGANNSNSLYNPVSNRAFDKYLGRYSLPKEELNNIEKGRFGYVKPDGQYSTTLDNIPISTGNVQKIRDMNDNLAEPVYVDKSVKTVIDDAVKDYLSGKLNEDRTARVINDKVEIFLNE